MSKKKTAIKVTNISKTYRQYKSNMQKIQYLLFWRDAGTKSDVLKDISFDIKKGEKVGIIGRPQSGKSTLMRIIAGIIRPDSGKVRTDGGLTAILDIRLGLDANLSVKDNYILMSNYLGRPAEAIAEHEDAVIGFAELSEEKSTLLRDCKKGSATKLGFATATEFGNDIILLDSDISFGSKQWNKACMARMKELVTDDTTLVMIVHKVADAAELCERGIVIHEGTLAFDGAFDEAIDYYKKNCRGTRKPEKDDIPYERTEESRSGNEAENDDNGQF